MVGVSYNSNRLQETLLSLIDKWGIETDPINKRGENAIYPKFINKWSHLIFFFF